MIKNFNLTVLSCLVSVTLYAQILKIDHPDLLRTISEGVLYREKVQAGVQKRSMEVVGFFALKKSYSEVVAERRQRIQTIRQEIVEANCDLCSGSKSSQDLEVELFSLLALGSLPEEKESGASVIERGGVVCKNWRVPGISVVPGNAGSDQNTDSKNAPVVDIQEQSCTLEELQRRYKTFETKTINQFQAGIKKREKAYLRREGRLWIETEMARFARQKTAHTQEAKAVKVSKSLPIQDVLPLEWEMDRKRENAMTFQNAQTYADFRKKDGWRLPTIWELYELYRQSNVLGSDFASAVLGDDYIAGFFWSDTPAGVDRDFHWQVGFLEGYILAGLDSHLRQVRLVRERAIGNSGDSVWRP